MCIANENGKVATFTVNGTAGGHITYPTTGGGASVTSLVLTTGDHEMVCLMADTTYAGDFKPVWVTPATESALGMATFGGASGCTTGGSANNMITANGSGGCTTDTNASLAAGALSLGLSGTAGSMQMGNATSGTITLQPVTGALGSVTASFPANTGTIAELNLAQTWTALQSFNSNDFALNGATSGSIKLNAAATAGSNTITLPAGTTDFSATGGASQVVKQTSSGGAFTVAQLACADLSNAGTACPASNTITLNAGANVAITAPGAMTLGGTFTFGSTSDTPRFAGLGLGGAATGANTLTIFGSVSGHIDFKTATAAGTNTLTFPAGTTDFSATGGASQVVEQTSSGGAFTVARLACADLSNAGTACPSSNTITLNAGANVAITAPGAMTLGNTYTFGLTSDTPRFAGLGLGGTATGANILTIFGSSSGHIDFKTAAAAGSNIFTFPAGTTDFSGTGGTSQVVKQTSSGGALTVARLACADLSDSGTGCSSSPASSITLNAGANVGITAPGAMTLGGTYTFGATTDTPRFAGLGLGGTASGANILTIFGSVSGHIDVETPTAAGSNVATIPANTGTIAELNLAQTWTALQNFNSNDFALNGATSGSIKLNAAAIAGSNTITFPAGTTDFSATGGASQVVKQTSSGGALTVAQLACSDLSNAGTGCSGTTSNKFIQATAVTVAMNAFGGI
jgi:hypothetical protein